MTDFSADPADFSPNDVRNSNRLSQLEMEDLRQAFRLLDTTGSGNVPVQDVLDVLDDLGKDDGRMNSTSRRTLERLYTVCAKLPPSETVNEAYFVQLIVNSHGKDNRSDIQRVFDIFSGGKGYIDLSNLSKIAAELGEDMSKEELEEMIHHASQDGDKVSFQQFNDIMNKKLITS